MPPTFIPGNPYRLRPARSSGSRRSARPAGWLAALAVIGLLLVQNSSNLEDEQFVYSSDEWGDFDLYVHTVGGERIAMLTYALGYDMEPEWSYDGDWLVYSSTDTLTGYADILRLAPPRQPEPSIIPDFGLEELFGVANLTEDPLTDDGGPALSWECQGKSPACVQWIAFHSNRDGDYDLYLMDLRGSDVRQLTDDPSDEVWPAWSPDGTRLIFMSDRDDPDWDLYSLDLTTQEVERYTHSEGVEDLWPAWSPDGRTIAWVSAASGWYRIWLMDAACAPTCGANKRLLVDWPDSQDEIHEFDPAWSPDGRWVMFASNRNPFAADPEEVFQWEYDIFAVHPDGSGIIQLTDDEIDDFTPAWRP